MTIVTSWSEMAYLAVQQFPELDLETLRANEGDMGAMIMQLSAAHHLTFSEAAEMVAFRLPVYVEEARLSA